MRLNLRIGVLENLEITRELAGFNREPAYRPRRTSCQQDNKHHKNRSSHGAYQISITFVLLVPGITCEDRFLNVLDPASRRLLRILANELTHAGDAVANRVIGGRVAETDVLAFIGYARAEVDISQHRHAGFVKQT